MPRLAWRQELASLSLVSSLGMEVKTGVWGPCWEKKKKRSQEQAQRTQTFLFLSFILKYRLREVAKQYQALLCNLQSFSHKDYIFI